MQKKPRAGEETWAWKTALCKQETATCSTPRCPMTSTGTTRRSRDARFHSRTSPITRRWFATASRPTPHPGRSRARWMTRRFCRLTKSRPSATVPDQQQTRHRRFGPRRSALLQRPQLRSDLGTTAAGSARGTERDPRRKPSGPAAGPRDGCGRHGVGSLAAKWATTPSVWWGWWCTRCCACRWPWCWPRGFGWERTAVAGCRCCWLSGCLCSATSSSALSGSCRFTATPSSWKDADHRFQHLSSSSVLSGLLFFRVCCAHLA